MSIKIIDSFSPTQILRTLPISNGEYTSTRFNRDLYTHLTADKLPPSINYRGPTRVFVEGIAMWEFAFGIQLPINPTPDSRMDQNHNFFLGFMMQSGKTPDGMIKAELDQEDDAADAEKSNATVYLNTIAKHFSCDLVNRVKIGRTNAMPQRQAVAAANCPDVVQTVCSINTGGYTAKSVERLIHRAFSHRRQTGENFDLNYFELSDLRMIKSVAQLKKYLNVALTPEARLVYANLNHLAVHGSVGHTAEHRAITVSDILRT